MTPVLRRARRGWAAASRSSDRRTGTAGDGSGGPLRLQVRDLGSTNGMRVDGHKVTSVAVRDGSTVVIGKTTITIVVTEEDVDV